MAAPMLALESGERRPDSTVTTYGAVTLAVALLAASGALLGAWLSLRSGTAVWPPKGVQIQNYFGTTLSITMLLGMLAAEWAVYGVKKREKGQAVGGLLIVFLLGVAFVNLLTYTVRVAHFGPGTHAYGAVFFAFNLLTGVSVAGVSLFAGVTLLRLLGGQVSSAEPALARSTALLWHAVSIAWFVMYAAVYVVK
jgi:cytochrome c oxidase subunit III